MNLWDVAIVGGGPAGLTAGIYASRAGLSTLICERGLPGGLASASDRIENYPGFPEGIPGQELGDLMRRQATRFGAQVAATNAEKLWREDDRVGISAGKDTVWARSAIVATGSTPKTLGVPGEASLAGRGLSYCATCDGPLYRDMVVAVVGGGDSALQEAIFLSRFAKLVILIHRRDRFRGAAVLADEVRRNPKILLSLDKTVRAIVGQEEVEGVQVEDQKTGKQELIPARGVFVYVGYTPNVSMLGREFKRGDSGFLLTDARLQTSVAGVFAAGDVREKTLRQVATAVGDGALAAMSAYSYLQSTNKQP